MSAHIHRWMSFCDMIEIGLVAESVALGSSLESQAAQYRARGSAELAPPGQRVVHNGIVYERESMAYNIATTTRACKKWNLQASMLLAFSLESWLRLGVPGTTFLELAGRIDALKSSILNEAAFRYYLIIPTELSGYANQERPLGDAVWCAFPSSRKDLREAGNCIALGRNTAAVYHTMCALEPAMKVLARYVRAPWNAKSSTWHGTLVEIEKRIKAIASGPKTKGLASRIAFFSQAASEFRYFKDGWRNDTMHARLKDTDKVEAERVLSHVKAFMTLIASRLKERGA